MVVQSERLLMRRFEAGDGDALYGWLGDEAVVRFEPYGTFTRQQCQKEAALRAENPTFWVVCLKGEDAPIGNITLLKQPQACWELGFALRRDAQGKGYAAEASRALLHRAFTVWQAHRVVARCNPQNTACVRLLGRLGLRLEGRFLQDVYFKMDEDGAPAWQDTLFYAMLREEWRQSAAMPEGKGR